MHLAWHSDFSITSQPSGSRLLSSPSFLFFSALPCFSNTLGFSISGPMYTSLSFPWGDPSALILVSGCPAKKLHCSPLEEFIHRTCPPASMRMLTPLTTGHLYLLTLSKGINYFHFHVKLISSWNHLERGFFCFFFCFGPHGSFGQLSWSVTVCKINDC